MAECEEGHDEEQREAIEVDHDAPPSGRLRILKLLM
jgi:hypothetical protein